MRFRIALIALTLVLVACGGSDEEAADDADTGTGEVDPVAEYNEIIGPMRNYIRSLCQAATGAVAPGTVSDGPAVITQLTANPADVTTGILAAMEALPPDASAEEVLAALKPECDAIGIP